jgi:hypothetical protein
MTRKVAALGRYLNGTTRTAASRKAREIITRRKFPELCEIPPPRRDAGDRFVRRFQNGAR